jgi:hypothetical protein
MNGCLLTKEKVVKCVWELTKYVYCDNIKMIDIRDIPGAPLSESQISLSTTVNYTWSSCGRNKSIYAVK